MNQSAKILSLSSCLSLAGILCQAATPSPTALKLLPGEGAKVTVASVKGKLAISNSNPKVMSASLSNGNVFVVAAAPGEAVLSVKDNAGISTVKVTVSAPLAVVPTALVLAVGQSSTVKVSNPTGTVSLGNSGPGSVEASLQGSVVTVKGKAPGKATLTLRDSKTTRTVAVQVLSGQLGSVAGTTEGRLLASNCFQCHGTYGSGGFDKLRGKSEAELLKELNEFAQGKEDPDGIMAAQARGYTPEQLKAIAKYLANP